MKKLFLNSWLLCALLSTGACQLRNDAPAKDWTAGIQPYVKRYCVSNQQCADVSIYLPMFRGEESASLGATNEQLQRDLLSLVQAPLGLPIEVTLDSVAARFFQGYNSFIQANPQASQNWQMRLTTTVPLMTPQLVTMEAKQSYNIYFDQKSELMHVVTYDFRTGKYLGVAELVRDTSTFRPMLEGAFSQARQLKSPKEISTLLSPGKHSLPMPRYIAIYPEGLRVLYNADEYSLLELPVTDMRFSWEQLGDLVEKSEWIK
ncbi:MAG: hypothetical protein JNK89_07955 [Saprospiraceae bacterium]|nr:hypothetical protein [Saprospiraceae bacterium]